MTNPTSNYQKARQKAAALYREERALDAYPLVHLQCDIVASRNLYATPRMCPPDLVRPVSTILWVAAATTMAGQVPELATLRQLLSGACGKTFTAAAVSNQGGRVEERVFRMLSLDRPLDVTSEAQLSVYLQDICMQHHVDWTPPPAPEPEQAERSPFLLPAVTGQEGGAYDARDETEETNAKSNPLPFNLRLEWVNSVWRNKA